MKNLNMECILILEQLLIYSMESQSIITKTLYIMPSFQNLTMDNLLKIYSSQDHGGIQLIQIHQLQMSISGGLLGVNLNILSRNKLKQCNKIIQNHHKILIHKVCLRLVLLINRILNNLILDYKLYSHYQEIISLKKANNL